MSGPVRRPLLALAACTAFGAGACASSGWPDEPGLPVSVSHFDNLRAGDAFLEAVTAARAGKSLPEPTVTPRFQDKIRRIGTALQEGGLSAPRARVEAERWGAAAFRRPVDAWVLDCAAGRAMKVPGVLARPPVVAIAFVAAHFQPRSLAKIQCAVVVVSVRGGERVALEPLGPVPPPKGR